MILDNFSAGYLIASDVRVTSHRGDYAIVSEETYDRLAVEVGEPVVVMVPTGHYELWPDSGILDDLVGIPEQDAALEDSALLVRKPGAGGFV